MILGTWVALYGRDIAKTDGSSANLRCLVVTLHRMQGAYLAKGGCCNLTSEASYSEIAIFGAKPIPISANDESLTQPSGELCVSLISIRYRLAAVVLFGLYNLYTSIAGTDQLFFGPNSIPIRRNTPPPGLIWEDLRVLYRGSWPYGSFCCGLIGIFATQRFLHRLI